MSGADRESHLSARDIVATADVAALEPDFAAARSDGKVGDEWIDSGAACDRERAQPGCFLSSASRLRLVLEFRSRVEAARVNYQAALLSVRVDELLKKDDDVPWVLSLVLDLAGAHVLERVTRAISSGRAAALASLDRTISNQQVHTGGPNNDSWASRAERTLKRIDGSRIEAFSKAAFQSAKKGTEKVAEYASAADAASEKETSLSYIQQLQNACDAGFVGLAAKWSSAASDAELVALWAGMDIGHHSIPAYTQLLTAKLARYRSSGVLDIGRKDAVSMVWHQPVFRDTRVVWVVGLGGRRMLWYQAQDEEASGAVVHPGDPATERFFPDWFSKPQQFGPRAPYGKAQLVRPVPEEFIAAALAKSEQRWGRTETLSDYWASIANGRQGGRDE